MSIVRKQRRGTTAEINAVTIPLSEIIHDTETDDLYLGGNGGNKLLTKDKFKNVLEFFSAVASDDSVMIQAAIDYATLNNVALYYPNKIYEVSQRITSGSGNVAMYGESANNTVIKLTTANASFDFAMNVNVGAQERERFSMRDMRIEIAANLSYPALTLKWSSWLPSAYYSLDMVNVHFEVELEQNYVYNALKIEKAFVGSIDKCQFIGGDIAGDKKAIEFVDCIDVRVTKPEIWGFDTGIVGTKNVSTQCEGIFIVDGFIYNVDKGISFTDAIHIQIVNTHVAIYKSSPSKCVEFTNVQQSFVGGGCLLYTGGNTGVATQNTVSLSNCASVIIEGNNLISLNDNTTQYGILFVDSTYCKAVNNYTENVETGVFISSVTSTNNIVSLNTFRLCDQTIVNSGGATNHVINNMDESGPI